MIKVMWLIWVVGLFGGLVGNVCCGRWLVLL